MTQPVLSIERLEVSYSTRAGSVRAVRDVSIEIAPGKVLGLVGESGCGKSTLAFAVMNYMPSNAAITAGRILFRGRDIVRMNARELKHLRGNEIAMVYQDPMAALNPSLKIGPQLTEVVVEHNGASREEAREACIRMLEKVRMPDAPAIMERYCHQLSGGQQQRVLIAMALLTNPALLIMDEPTTGLDVTVEAEILDLIGELKRELDTAILFISHSFGVINRVADRVAVMYAGELVEQATVRDIFLEAQAPVYRRAPGMRSEDRCGQETGNPVADPGESPRAARGDSRLRFRIALRPRPGPLPPRASRHGGGHERTSGALLLSRQPKPCRTANPP